MNFTLIFTFISCRSPHKYIHAHVHQKRTLNVIRHVSKLATYIPTYVLHATQRSSIIKFECHGRHTRRMQWRSLSLRKLNNKFNVCTPELARCSLFFFGKAHKFKIIQCVRQFSAQRGNENFNGNVHVDRQVCGENCSVINGAWNEFSFQSVNGAVSVYVSHVIKDVLPHVVTIIL